MLALDTIRFTLEHVGGGDVELFPGVEWQRMEGQVDMPDRLKVRVEATSTFPRSFIDISIVAIGDQAFIRDFINKEKWHQVSVDTLPFNFADLGRILSDIFPSVQNPTFNGMEIVDGVPSWRVKGIVHSEGLAALVLAVDPGYEVRLESWIGQDEGLLRKLTVEGQMVSADSPDAMRVLTIHSFDEPVEISLPKISE